jgi:miniconductance mechanosensitive channel
MESALDLLVENYWILTALLIIGSYFLVLIIKRVVSRLAYLIVIRTETLYDDLLVDNLIPYHFLWLIPLGTVLSYVDVLYPTLPLAGDIITILIAWASIDLITSLTDGINEIYRTNPKYRGVSIAGYLGLFKVFTYLIGFVFSLSILLKTDTTTIISQFGAWLAVLLLIFRDTILSFVASLKIHGNQLVHEGDWIEVPSLDISGTVTEISLDMILVTNFDATTSTIPTHQLPNLSFKNYKNIVQIGARRLKKAMFFNNDDVNQISPDIFDALLSKELVTEDERGLNTNLELYLSYAKRYLESKNEVLKGNYTLVVRLIDIESYTVKVEVYCFVKAKTWQIFENIHAEILLHLYTTAREFGLFRPLKTSITVQK